MNTDYFLCSKKEKDRLQLQAGIWEADAEAMLDRIGVNEGWTSVDLGCGAMGILGPLGRRVGPSGRVIGVDSDENLLKVGRSYLEQEELNFVELHRADITDTVFPQNMFDLVHSRFLLPHVSDPDSLLREMIRIAKPGGVISIQESDHSSWKFWPDCPGWDRLLKICEDTFALKNDLNMGRRIFAMLRRAGLEAVEVRAAVKALQDAHPYMRMVLTGVEAIRQRAIDAGISTAEELDRLVKSVENCVSDPDYIQITFTLIQAWGKKAGFSAL